MLSNYCCGKKIPCEYSSFSKFINGLKLHKIYSKYKEFEIIIKMHSRKYKVHTHLHMREDKKISLCSVCCIESNDNTNSIGSFIFLMFMRTFCLVVFVEGFFKLGFVFSGVI